MGSGDAVHRIRSSLYRLQSGMNGISPMGAYWLHDPRRVPIDDPVHTGFDLATSAELASTYPMDMLLLHVGVGRGFGARVLSSASVDKLAVRDFLGIPLGACYV